MKKYKLNFRKALKALAKGKVIECAFVKTDDNVIKCQMRLTDKGIQSRYCRDFRHLPLGDIEWSRWEVPNTWEWGKENFEDKYRIVKDND